MKAMTQMMTVAAATLLLMACGNNDSTSEVSGMTLTQAVNENPARDPENLKRDVYRNPIETLTFFDVQPDMTVVEIWPGGGWYTEILAPYLKEQGQLYAAHFPQSETRDFYVNSRKKFVERVASDEAFGAIQVTEFAPSENSAIAPAGSVDRILTFRNLHNWYMGGGNQALEGAFATFYTALKPGGILGVVDHRLPEQRPVTEQDSSGYMKASIAIAAAQAAGFVLVAESDINANPEDTAAHPRGVWSLPPTLSLGEQDRARYQAIGESDRFTLKFKKPETSS
ncbi:methyltransferase [Pseudidiomarina sediminum]|uniref:Methyltransferase n=1 Tax=Pseudidiomarina sediminum TaxID=431675 RepID=A0A432Z278_9GAMM|nr:class I SAM-dependent methyltransferase [Pseudidiomarina sediminum]RUO72004.1 methyltransferase [Pseudidiomarina sediminum]